MLVTAALGMTTKFVEVTLSHKYREFAEDGTASVDRCIHEEQIEHEVDAALFAVAAIISSFGTGNMPKSTVLLPL